MLYCSSARNAQMIVLWAELGPDSLGLFHFWLGGRSTCTIALELTTAHYVQSCLWHFRCSTGLTLIFVQYLNQELKFQPGFHWISINSKLIKGKLSYGSNDIILAVLFTFFANLFTLEYGKHPFCWSSLKWLLVVLSEFDLSALPFTVNSPYPQKSPFFSFF